jgi:hypothetical protein
MLICLRNNSWGDFTVQGPNSHNTQGIQQVIEDQISESHQDLLQMAYGAYEESRI